MEQRVQDLEEKVRQLEARLSQQGPQQGPQRTCSCAYGYQCGIHTLTKTEMIKRSVQWCSSRSLARLLYEFVQANPEAVPAEWRATALNTWVASFCRYWQAEFSAVDSAVDPFKPPAYWQGLVVSFLAFHGLTWSQGQ